MTATAMLGALVPMAAFLGMVALAAFVRPGASPRDNKPVRVLIAYVLVLSWLAGFSGRDLWPFAAWRYVRYTVADTGSYTQFVAVDEAGIEHPLDPRALDPLEMNEFIGVIEYRFDRLGAEQRDALFGFILERAREGLRRRQAGETVGTFARYLGPVSAPTFQTETSPWPPGASLPRELRELRMYRVHWRMHPDAARVERRELLGSKPL